MLLGLVELPAAAALFGAMVMIWQAEFSLIEGVYKGYFALVLFAIIADNLRQLREPGFLTTATWDGETRLVLGRTAVVAMVWLGFLAARQDHSVSRRFLFTYLFLLPPTLMLTRWAASVLLAPKVFSANDRVGIILLGNPDESSEELIKWLSSKQSIGVHLLGYLGSAITPMEQTIPWLGAGKNLTSIVEQTQAQIVVSLGLPADDSRARWLRESCDRCGARLIYQCRLGGDSPSRISICQDDGVSLLSIRSEPLQSPFNRLIKRIFDLCLSVPIVVFVLPPLTVLVWLLHRFQSPGPLLFKQARGGMAGKPFTILKFRTMHCDGHDQATQAVSGDKRVFKSGAWLRKYSIDEFPQFLNVLEGSMSIVGPRPHLEVHDAAFSKVSSEYRIRALIKPGITGLAQVEGHRGPTPEEHHINARVKADLRYLETWTLSADFIVVLRTIWHILKPTNAV